MVDDTRRCANSCGAVTGARVRTILVGFGQIAHRIRALATANGCEIVMRSRENVSLLSHGEPTFESIVRMVRDVDLTSISSAYLGDDRDEVNLEHHG